MMSGHFVEDLNRREINLHSSKVRELLPEYFVTDYPNLILFLEKYYEFLLEIDNSANFDRQIQELYTVRDISQASLSNLDQIIGEIGNGLKAASFFQEPRLMGKLLPAFYSSKGTILSMEGFFRAFFNEEISVQYPKRDMFIVGQSKIGYESQKFIQNAGIYQIFSILIKVGRSAFDYLQLYTKFVHPAGFHFQGEVQTEGNVTVGVTAELLEEAAEGPQGAFIGTSPAILPRAEFVDMTGFRDSSDGISKVRVRLYENDAFLQTYQTLTVETMLKYFDTIAGTVGPNSFTFDDSDNISRPDFASIFETMDVDMFTTYDSAI